MMQPPLKKPRKSAGGGGGGLFQFFKHKDPAAAKKPRRRYRFEGGSVALPLLWYSRDDSCLVRRMEGANFESEKVAAFDFDGCLTTDAGPIGSGSGGLPIREGVIEKLQALYDGTVSEDSQNNSCVAAPGENTTAAGMKVKIASTSEGRNDRHRLVIFTNGANIGNMRKETTVMNAIVRKTSRLNEFVRRLQRPVEIFVATKKDKYRKGIGTGLWDALLEDPNLALDLNSNSSSSSSSMVSESSAMANKSDVDKRRVTIVAPRLSASFFVGDAAGREDDFSDSDKKFAEAVGLEFFTETDFFGQPYRSSAHLIDLWKEVFGYSQILVVLVGAPGSGKSHFCQTVLEEENNSESDGNGNDRWAIVCQDVLKSRDRCMESCRELLNLGKCVLVDRTNIDKEQRQIWISIAKGFNIPCIAIEFGGQNKRELITNVLTRSAGSHGTGLDASKSETNVGYIVSKFLSRQQPTLIAEGFNLVFRCEKSLSYRQALANTLSEWSLKAMSNDYQINPQRKSNVYKCGHRTLLVPTMEADSMENALQVLWDESRVFLSKEENTNLSIEVFDVTEKASSQKKSALNGRLIHLSGCSPAERIFFPSRIPGSRATMVAVPAVFKFAAGGPDVNRYLHRHFNESRAQVTESPQDAMTLRTYTQQYHSSCPPGVYSCPVPTSNASKFTHIFHCIAPRIVDASKRESSSQLSSASAASSSTEVESNQSQNASFDDIMAAHYRQLFDQFRKSCLVELKSGDVQAGSDATHINKSAHISSDAKDIGLISFPTEWSEPLSPPIRKGSWRNVLDAYISKPRDLDCEARIFLETSRFVCIYDAYPKAKIHLLVVPKPDFLDVKYPHELTSAHCERVEILHQAAKAIARQVQLRFIGSLSPGHHIKIGYHRRPSLSRMHIHLISDDLNGRAMKTKKHRDSFETDFFVPIDQILLEASLRNE